MLVLSRRVGEQIVIGDEIRVLVRAIKGKKVRLAISAPAQVPIFRSELIDLQCAVESDSASNSTSAI